MPGRDEHNIYFKPPPTGRLNARRVTAARCFARGDFDGFELDAFSDGMTAAIDASDCIDFIDCRRLSSANGS